MVGNRLTIVVNLDRRTIRRMFALHPREAVMTAYAQSIGDWDMWGYERNYGDVVIQAENGYSCGSFYAMEPVMPDPIKPTRPVFTRHPDLSDDDWSILKRMLEVLTIDELKAFCVIVDHYADSVEVFQEVAERAIRDFREAELRYASFEKKRTRR